MARIRTVKPEVHLNEDLWDAEQETGLPLFRGFVGLWNHADREGRFEWRPRKLKAGILPYWDGDFSRVLDALTTRGFLVRYASQGLEYGAVSTFKKHQVVNNREHPSVLPAPPSNTAEIAIDPVSSTRGRRVGDACPTPLVHAQAEGKGREGKGKECVARVREATPPIVDPLPLRVTQVLGEAYLAATRKALPKTRRLADDARRTAGWLRETAEVRGVSCESLLSQAVSGFIADPKARSQGYPYSWFFHDPSQFLDSASARSGPAPAEEWDPHSQEAF